MVFVQKFTELNKDNSDIAGGKGASLGEMTKAGIPVPPGFVVLSDAFEKFIHETDLIQEIDAILGAVNHNEISTIERASEKIQGLINAVQIPEEIVKNIISHLEDLNSEFVAVRSSATAEDGVEHAWAGQLESYLNVTNDQVIDKIQHCWASLFTPRAIFYRFEKGLSTTKISVAVVVQSMINSEVSGIAFSVHPITEDKSQIVIEAGFGLGEAIVSGQITPDSYVVVKDPLEIIDVNISRQDRGLFRNLEGGSEWKELGDLGRTRVLSDERIFELSQLIIKIENHYGFPCDIEWAFENGKFYIVQSRPITTLSRFFEKKENPELFDRYMFLPEGGRSLYGHIGYAIIHSYAVQIPEWPMPIKGAIESRNHAARWYFVVRDESEFVAYLNECVSDSSILKRMEDTIVKEREAIVKEIMGCDLGSIDKAQLAKLFAHYYSSLENLIRIAGRVRYLDRAIMYKFRESFDNADEYLRTVSVSDKLTYPTKEQIAVWKIGEEVQKGKNINDPEIEQGINNLCEEFKWCQLGYYTEVPKNREDYIGMIKDSKNLASSLIDELQSKHRADLVSRENMIKQLNPEQKAWADIAATSTYLKDFYKYSVSKVIYFAENLFNELSKRSGEEKTVLKDMIPSEVHKLIMEGAYDKDFSNKFAEQYAMYVHGDKFKVMIGSDANDFLNTFLSVKDKDKKVFRGRVASRGRGTGTAKVVINSSDFTKFKEGDVLIAINTSPDFVPLMKMAAAIIAEEGGLTSHTSVVSRELGIPCVVGVTDICSIFKDGDMVEVDVERGMVKKI